MNRQDFDAAIVDLDGTMVDTLGDFELALGAALAEIGLPPVPRSFIARTVGKGSRHLLTEVLRHAGQGVAPDSAAIETLWTAYQRHYAAANGRASTVYPGVLEGLTRLRDAGLQLACLTNKPGAFARALLVAKGLDGFFSHVFGGDAFVRSKPDPLPLLETCRALGTLPARTLMVGDSSNDARAARAAGCPVVLVRYGYNHGEPVEAAGADGLVHRLDALFS
ncbi:MAG: phosphoglycolate phosphatase [Rubrivivax sp.]|nr:phosphoglycolate phosphatase [Rubrivivax sp.]